MEQQSVLPVLLFKEDLHNSAKIRFSLCANALTAVLEFYKTTGLGVLTFEELGPLLQDPVVFIYDTLNPNQKQTMPGFSVDKHKVIEMQAIKPAWYEQLISIVEKANDTFSVNSTKGEVSKALPHTSNSYLKYFAFNATTSKIEVKEQITENLKERYTTRATRKEAIKVLEFGQKFLALVEEYKMLESSESLGVTFDDFMGRLLPYSLVNKNIELNLRFINSNFNIEPYKF